jgi:hypothetical protein
MNDAFERIRRMAEAAGKSFSQTYLEYSQDRYKKLQKQIPVLWKTVMGKRYILPHHRQRDYFSQEICDYSVLDSCRAWTQGAVAEHIDEVLHTQYAGMVMEMLYGRPTYFLEREISKALMETKLPDDFMIEDIRWVFPAFRVYLPKGLLTIHRQGVDQSMMYLDLLKVDKDVSYEFSPAIKEELRLLGGWYFVPFKNNYDGMGVSGNLDFDGSEAGMGYAATAPLNGITIKKLLDYQGTRQLESALRSDEVDQIFINQMQVLGVNILMFLSSYPIEAEKLEDAKRMDKQMMIRPPKMEGDRLISGLYKAKFIGDSYFRDRPRPTPAGTAGYHVAEHWTKGHWRRVAHGPKMGQRRLQWIGMYKSGGTA